MRYSCSLLWRGGADQLEAALAIARVFMPHLCEDACTQTIRSLALSAPPFDRRANMRIYSRRFNLMSQIKTDATRPPTAISLSPTLTNLGSLLAGNITVC
jgi:hypothetical protein